MKISGIYKIQSLIKPERCYIGSSVNIEYRWYRHKNDLINNNHGNKKLQNHFNKYGASDFVYSLILACDKESIPAHEQFFLDALNPFFNINKRVDEIHLYGKGSSHTDEHNKKIADAQKGDKNSFANKHHTRESNSKRSEWNLSHPLSVESRKKQRESLLKTIARKKAEKLLKLEVCQ